VDKEHLTGLRNVHKVPYSKVNIYPHKVLYSRNKISPQKTLVMWKKYLFSIVKISSDGLSNVHKVPYSKVNYYSQKTK